ncbi:monocarboxylate transporter 10 isoform X2 [Cylas formicarius]|uniref:monocarboxylate transporter 10 isoform X2 n=1 Tax=Cylas formicarius TaxID=197179 RepID=UPI0029585F54|nr:monocarboxylate transporter 10 isoform X2 [Cylas formicarius]
MVEIAASLYESEDEQNKKFLNTSQNGQITTKISEENDEHPMDEGARAWLVMVASFLCHGILFGVINSYGVFYSEFYARLESQNVSNPSGKAALAGSLAMGMTFFISPISGVLTDYIGIRKTTFLGGAIASLGMFLSSFCTNNITAFCFTYGIVYGLGGALTYTPCLAVLGHYFDKYLGIVNGIVTAGSSTFTIAMPYILDSLLKTVGLDWTLRFLALLAAFLMALAILFKPVKKTSSIRKVSVKDIFNMDILTNPKYIIWISVIGLCLFGYFVPYVYMFDFVKNNFRDTVDNKLPVLCIGIMSGVSRPVVGMIVDRTKVDKILLQQLAFLLLGILTVLLPFTETFPMLLVICLGMGITDGCFISLLGPVAFEICGKEGAAQGIGFLLGVCSVPLTIGPYIAGLIYDNQRSYTLPFVLAGINPALASFGMLAIRCVRIRSARSERSTIEERLNISEKEEQGSKDLDNIQGDDRL